MAATPSGSLSLSLSLSKSTPTLKEPGRLDDLSGLSRRSRRIQCPREGQRQAYRETIYRYYYQLADVLVCDSVSLRY